MAVHKILSTRHSRKPLTAAYVRVSTEKDEQAGSLEAQKKYYEKLIRSNLEWDFVGIYAEKASGTDRKKRSVFEQLIEDAVAGKVDLILCKSLSRWARNTIDALDSIKKLTGNHVRVLFDEENIDTDDPGMLIQLALGFSVAQEESRSLSENVKWTYRNRAKHGIFVAQRGKYFGFDTDDGTFKPDANAGVVKDIFEAYVEGASLSEIASILNEAGVKTLQGRKWQPETVKRILRNEVYVGDIRFQKKISRDVITGEPDKEQIDEYKENHHVEIVDRATWDRTQKRLDAYRERYSKLSEDMPLRVKDQDVLMMINDGWSGRKIADHLGITIAEEKSCVRRLKKKGLIEDRSVQGIDDRINKLMEIIKEKNGVSVKDIMESLDITRRQANYAIQKMLEQGLIEKDSDGLWRA